MPEVRLEPPIPLKPNVIIKLTWDEMLVLRTKLGVMEDPGEHIVSLWQAWRKLCEDSK